MAANSKIDTFGILLVILYSLTPLNLIAPAAIIFVIYHIIKTNHIDRYNIAIGLPFLFFVLVIFIQSMTSGAISQKSFVDIYRWLLIGITIIFLSRKNSVSLLYGFYYFFILTFIYCVLQQVAPENSIVQWINSKYVSEDLMQELFVPGFVRSTGFNQGPGHVGLVAVVGLLISHILFPSHRTGKYTNLINTILASLIIVMAAAKGAAIALLALIVLINFKKNSRYLILTAAMAATLFVIYFDEIYFLLRLLQFDSGAERISIWTEIIKSIPENLLWVLFGYGRIGAISEINIFDSDIVFLYVTQGVIGILMFVFILINISRKITSNIYAALGLTLVLCLAGMTNPFLTDIKFGIIYFSLLIGLKDFKENENLYCHH